MKNLFITLFVFTSGILIGINLRIKEIEKLNNQIVFEWEGLEKDIPKDGEYIQITGTDENTVYLNAIDE